jgi:hypothetical protein
MIGGGVECAANSKTSGPSPSKLSDKHRGNVDDRHIGGLERWGPEHEQVPQEWFNTLWISKGRQVI